MMKTRIFACAVLLALFAAVFAASSARADARAKEINSLFEGMCLSYLGDIEKIVTEAKSIGAKPLPQIYAQQFLGGHRGIAWAVQGSGGLYMLGVTEQPTCVVAAPEADAAAALEMFDAGPRRARVATEVIHRQLQLVYATIKQDAQTGQHKKMVVIVTVSTSKGTPGIIFKALPAATARMLGFDVASWPE